MIIVKRNNNSLRIINEYETGRNGSKSIRSWLFPSPIFLLPFLSFRSFRPCVFVQKIFVFLLLRFFIPGFFTSGFFTPCVGSRAREPTQGVKKNPRSPHGGSSIIHKIKLCFRYFSCKYWYRCAYCNWCF